MNYFIPKIIPSKASAVYYKQNIFDFYYKKLFVYFYYCKHYIVVQIKLIFQEFYKLKRQFAVFRVFNYLWYN